MKEFWDSRYDTDQFVYGKEPNLFFASELEKLDPGNILLPGEGEGRNAVFAASLGWDVDAFDQSAVGSRKALGLARKMEVHLNYKVSGLEDYAFKPEYYEAIGLTYFHASPEVRRFLHKHVQMALVPRGILILEAFHTSQLGNPTGGPPSRDMLFDEEMLLKDFSGLDVLLLEELSVDLNESNLHRGAANIIRFIGKKKI